MIQESGVGAAVGLGVGFCETVGLSVGAAVGLCVGFGETVGSGVHAAPTAR